MMVLTVVALLSAWSLITVQFVHVQQFCSNAMRWRITFQTPDEHSLSLGPGIYMASSYTMSNGFGLRGVTRTSIVVLRRGGG